MAEKSIKLTDTGLDVVHLGPNDTVSIDGVDYQNLSIELIGTDLIAVNESTGEKIVFPGLALILFDEEQAPSISFNGQIITPKMFSDKIGVVSNVDKGDFVSFTTLDVSDEKKTPLAPDENKEENEKLKKEVDELKEKIQEVLDSTDNTELLLNTLALENADLLAATENLEDTPELESERSTSSESDGGVFVPAEDNNFTSNDDSSASSSASPASETSSNSSTISNFSFSAFILQPSVIEDDTGTFTVQGGGGSTDATFNPSNTVQLSSETLDYSTRTDDIIINADNANLFDDTHISRAIEVVPTLPNGFELVSAEVTGLPVGFEVVNGTPTADGYEIDLSLIPLNERGNLQFDLKYPIPNTQNFEIEITVKSTFDVTSDFPAPSQTDQEFVLNQKIEQKDVTSSADLNYTDGDGDFVWVLTNQANQNTILSGSGNDTLNGSNGVDTIFGGDGNDIINALSGDDIIDSGDGSDTIMGGAGSDTITGGTNTDLLDYTNVTEDITLDMNVVDGDGYASATFSGSGDVDRVRQVENITGGTGNDTITGDSGDNHIIGGDGDDVLDGGLGTDTLDGGDGVDTVSFISGGSGLTVNLGTGSTLNVGTGIKTILNIENITATNFNDTITAIGGDNAINGADGDDVFITDGDGNDVLDGGFSGVDTSLNDTIDYGTSVNGITVDLTDVPDVNGFVNVLVGGTTDLIKGIENIYGSSAAINNIVGNDASQEIRGGSANDILSGNGGDDVIRGGAGSDTLDGGSTLETATGDTLDLSDLTLAFVTLNLATSSSGTAVSGVDTDNFSNFERYILTSLDDVVNGSTGNDIVSAGDGNDTFYASSGSDTFDGEGGAEDTIDYTTRGAGVYIEADLRGGSNVNIDVRNSGDDSLLEQDTINNIESIIGTAGTDSFINGSGDNKIDGAGGSDTLSYEFDTVAISFNMKLTTGGFFDITSGGDTDSISNIENIIGSTAGDTMAGNASANDFEGGAGNDTFIASEGGDTYLGGSGVDTVRYHSLAGLNNVSVNLSSGASLDLGILGADASDTSDVYSDNIERVTLTSGDDAATGNALDNTIFDLGGDDVINGSGGTNTVDYSLLSGQNVIVDLGAGTADDDGGAGATDTLVKDRKSVV